MKIKRLGAVLFAAAVAVLSGCATNLPSTEEMKADTAAFQLPKLPEPNKAMVYVVRPAFIGTAVRFNVFVDDQESKSEMGYTRGKQYIYFHVAPGEHKIFSKAENWAEVSLNAKPGDVFFIQQEPSMGVIMARNTLFKLEDYQGKYHVKRLNLGTIIKTDK